MGALPGVNILDIGSIRSYILASADQDPSSQAAAEVMRTLIKLHEAREKISSAKTGGSYELIAGVYTSRTGAVDLEKSLMLLLS
jgi:hypothetical protein